MQINQYQSLLTKCEYIEAVSDSIIKNLENQEQLQMLSKLNVKIKPSNQLISLEQKQNHLNTNIMRYQQLQLKQKLIEQSYQYEIQQAYLKIRKLKQQKSQIGKIKHQKVIQNRTLMRMAKQLKQLQKELFNQRKLLNLQIKNDNSLKQNNLQVLQSISKAERRQIQLKKIKEAAIQAEKQHLNFKTLQDKYEKLASKKQQLLFESSKYWQKINNQCQNKIDKIGEILNYDQELDQYISKLITKVKQQQFIIQQIQKREMQKLAQYLPNNQIVEEENSQQEDDYFRHQIQNLRKTIANRKFNQRVKLFNQQKLISLGKEYPDRENDKNDRPTEYSSHNKIKRFSENIYNNPSQKRHSYQPEKVNQLKAKMNFGVTPKRRISHNKNNDSQIFKISVQPVSHSKNIKLKSQNREQEEQKYFKNIKTPKIGQTRKEYNQRVDQQQLYRKKRQYLQKMNENQKNFGSNTKLNKEEFDYILALLEQKQEELMKLSKVDTKNSSLKPFKYSPLYKQNQRNQFLDNDKIKSKSRLTTEPLPIKYHPYKKQSNQKNQNTSSDLFGKTRSQIMNKLKSRIRIRTRQTEQQRQKQIEFKKKQLQHQKSSRSINFKQRHKISVHNKEKHKKKIKNQQNQKRNSTYQLSLNNQDDMPESIYSRHSMNLHRKINDVQAQKINSNDISPNTTASNLKRLKYKSKVEDINSQDDKIQSLLTQLKRLKQSKNNFSKGEQNQPIKVNSERTNSNDQKIQVFKFSKNRKSRISSANKSKGKIQQRESGSQQQQLLETLQKIEEQDESIKNTINHI